MNDVINAIVQRRSIRKYRPQQIADTELDTILLAGLYAPSAGSRQGVLIGVCQDEELNKALGRMNKGGFKGRMSDAARYISKDQPSIADDPNIQSGFYGAPTVLTLFGAKGFLYGEADCCVAAQSIMLAAHSIGIGSCMVMRAQETFSSELGQKLQAEWGIGDDYEAKAHITLGYPEGAAQAKPRKENRIRRMGEYVK